MHSLLQRNSTLEYHDAWSMVVAENVMLSGDFLFFLRTYARAVDDNLNVPQGIVTCCASRKENVPAKDRYQEDDDNKTQTLMRSLAIRYLFTSFISNIQN